MEFIQEFAVIQGALLTLQKKVGLLKKLNEEETNNQEKIQTVVDAVIKAIKSLGDIDSSSDNNKLRQISLYLILNSNLEVCDLLLEDTNYGHLINSAPTLSCDLLVSVFCEPILNNLFYELILYCPPLLGVELLEVAAKKLKKEDESLTTPFAVTLTRAIYVKLLLQNYNESHKCEVDCVALKMIGYYTKFCQYFTDHKRENNCDLNVDRSEGLGKVVLSSLELVASCLKNYINPVALCGNLIDVYSMNVTFDYKKWHQDSECEVIDFMHEQLFSLLFVQITRITVDIWLGWAELNSRFTPGCSLQKDIAESMYRCLEVIQESMKKGVKSEILKTLVLMLTNMSCKPRDEDDEIKEADIALILKRIPDKLYCQKKWLIALLTKLDEVLVREECLECIKENIHLLDYDVIALFLNNLILFVEKNKEFCSLPERLKYVILASVRKLSLTEQLNILDKFLNKCGINTYLCSEEYGSKVTKIFNSAVNVNEVSHDQKYTEFVNLSLQNPPDVIKRIIKQAVASDKQAKIMVDILLVLRPFHCLSVDKNSQHSFDFLISVIHDVMQEHTNMEFTNSSFVSLITLLSTNHAIQVDDFLKFSLYPLMHKSLMDQNWSDVVLWLETLEVFVDGTVQAPTSLDVSTLLLTLAQILELSRKTVFSFSCAALMACDHAINIINIVLESLCEEEKREETISVLYNDIIHLTSPINVFYFFDLWSTCEGFSQFTRDWKVYLLHWSHMEKCNQQPPWSCNMELKTQKKLVVELTKLLPMCVQNEWRTIIQNLNNIVSPTFCEVSNTFLFECLVDVIQVIALMCSPSYLSDEERDCAFSCLDFCIRNFTAVVKEELFGKHLTMSPIIATEMLQKIVYLNLVLPSVVQESCAGLLLSMQMDIIAHAVSDMLMYLNEDEEERQILEFQSEKTFKDMSIVVMIVDDRESRQALARKLLDGMGVICETQKYATSNIV